MRYVHGNLAARKSESLVEHHATFGIIPALSGVWNLGTSVLRRMKKKCSFLSPYFIADWLTEDAFLRRLKNDIRLSMSRTNFLVFKTT